MSYYSFQRSKDYHYATDPSYADIGFSAGIKASIISVVLGLVSYLSVH